MGGESMTLQTVVLILSILLVVCAALLLISTVYFLWQWKNLDNILDSFQNESFHDAGSNVSHKELHETRESRIASQLRQILNNAHFTEKQSIEEKNQVMELISDLSHQLKTPLANIIMNMELLQDAALTEERRKEFLEHTKSQADKMQWLMANLLKASRLENGMIHFTAKNTGIKETIAKALGAVYAQASTKHIELSVEEFQDFSLYHNPKWTAEAMANILENAIKYSPENSSIRITVSRLDIYTRITISDEGIGIPTDEFNQIFKRFYRGKDVEQQEGSGLGLYLAQLIAHCEKGYITVSSKVGQGSSFSLFLLNPIPPLY